MGGDLHPDRLICAYRQGVFPWFTRDQPLLWWSPDPRFVLYTREFRVNRALRRLLTRRPWRVTMDRCFDAVIRRCASADRPGQEGTWITTDMISSYGALHRRGVCHSVEVWLEGELVGGLYGVALGRSFSGESMFSAVTGASRVAMAHLVAQFLLWDVPLIDCQLHTDYLASMGAREVPREEYLSQHEEALARPPLPAPWRLEVDDPLAVLTS